MAYPTLSESKTWMGISTSTDDTLLTDILANAKAWIEGPEGANRAFEVTADSTRYFDCISRDCGGPLDGALLWLDKDLCQITSVVNGDGATLTSGTHYSPQPRNEAPYYTLRLYPDSGTSWTYTTRPEDAIAITGRWGFSTSAPADIKQICLELVKLLYKGRDGDSDQPVISQDGIVIDANRVPRRILAVIRAYRRRGL